MFGIIAMRVIDWQFFVIHEMIMKPILGHIIYQIVALICNGSQLSFELGCHTVIYY